jgi:thioredoxin-dependent peroxiredoxin
MITSRRPSIARIPVLKSDKRKAVSDMLKEGDKAPAFELTGDDGKTVKLSQFKGKPVVVYFYPKDDTSGCTTEAIGFSAQIEAFHAAGAEVLGISPDGVKSHGKFRDKHGLKVKLLADEEKKAIEAYGVWAEKKMYGRAYMGVDRSTFLIGKDGALKRIWRGVKVPGHVDEVLAAVQAL